MSDEEPKKKGSALIAIAFGKKKPGGDDGEEEGSDDDVDSDAEGLSAAGDEVWDAVQSKDKDAFKDALGRYVRLCHDTGDSDDGDEE